MYAAYEQSIKADSRGYAHGVVKLVQAVYAKAFRE